MTFFELGSCAIGRCCSRQSRSRLRLYDGTVVAPAGQIRLEVTNPKTMQRYNCEFIVVSGAAVSLIGAKTSLAMGLLKVEYQNIANADASVNEKPVLTRDAVMERYRDVSSFLKKLVILKVIYIWS